MRYWPHHMIVLFILALIFGMTQNAWAIKKGKVFIINKSESAVEILIKKRSNLGFSYWKHLTSVSKNKTRILNRIPSGTTLGFRTPGGKKKWPPRKFVFTQRKDEHRLTLRPKK